ncbi:MAG: ABC transporter ATP-binding protein [Fibrobacter sp.]|nr:ABC transporter ATP-binding protein [Fibrobacter sp.]
MLIELRHVSKVYSMGSVKVRALEDVSLSIARGGYVSIMGPSGSGKSTLMNILGCLDTPSGGRYILDGEDVSGMDEDSLAAVRNRSIGFVFQTFNLIAGDTALHNVELPMLYAGVSLPERRSRAQEVLNSVGLEHRINHRPAEMSGGERQRVAIARALVNDPPLILADEPTGNLDTRTGREILEIFESLFEQGKTLILVTHDQDVGSYAQRIIRVRDGLLEGDERVK